MSSFARPHFDKDGGIGAGDDDSSGGEYESDEDGEGDSDDDYYEDDEDATDSDEGTESTAGGHPLAAVPGGISAPEPPSAAGAGAVADIRASYGAPEPDLGAAYGGAMFEDAASQASTAANKKTEHRLELAFEVCGSWPEDKMDYSQFCKALSVLGAISFPLVVPCSVFRFVSSCFVPSFFVSFCKALRRARRDPDPPLPSPARRWGWVVGRRSPTPPRASESDSRRARVRELCACAGGRASFAASRLLLRRQALHGAAADGLLDQGAALRARSTDRRAARGPGENRGPREAPRVRSALSSVDRVLVATALSSRCVLVAPRRRPRSRHTALSRRRSLVFRFTSFLVHKSFLLCSFRALLGARGRRRTSSSLPFVAPRGRRGRVGA